ncbi:MAG: DUF6345 domain-containing protein [Thermoplasmata archaeon]
MGTKWRVFGIGIVLFALFWCSVAQMPTVNAGNDDTQKEVLAEWVNQYNGKAGDLPYSDIDAYGRTGWWWYWPILGYVYGTKPGFGYVMSQHGWETTVWGNNNAIPDDFARPAEFGASRDFIYFAGHGTGGGTIRVNGQFIHFSAMVFGTDQSSAISMPPNSYDPLTQPASNYADSYETLLGDNDDVEWLTLSCCRGLAGGASAVCTQTWGYAMYHHTPTNTQGIHVVNGYVTDSYWYGTWSWWDHKTRGAIYAECLFEGGTQNGYLKRAVGFAWQRATIRDVSENCWGEHHYIVGASVAAVGNIYENGELVDIVEYFYEDTIDSPLPDPINKNIGNIISIYTPQYYEWVVDQ